MPYGELVKNINSVRDYMRDFYVYGFKSRDEYTKKSARTYDDERRRIESWLGDYMGFRQTPEGKNVFLSIDSRILGHNPLYQAWKTKSFTDGDITLHFLLMDMLAEEKGGMSIGEIMEELDERLSVFSDPRLFDESTVRIKLKEYVSEGIICTERRGKTVLYRRSAPAGGQDFDLLAFFSEVAPCGVIGSYLLDKEDVPINLSKSFSADKENASATLPESFRSDKKAISGQASESHLSDRGTGFHSGAELCLSNQKIVAHTLPGALFSKEKNASGSPAKEDLTDQKPFFRDHFFFKHHYITGAFDSEVMCLLFEAMHEKSEVRLRVQRRRQGSIFDVTVVPLKVLISVQSGRQYLMAYFPNEQRISSFRLDSILSVKTGKVREDFEDLREKLDEIQKHMWGVITRGHSGQEMDHVSFTIRAEDREEYIRHRLFREKRCGRVEVLDANHLRFEADVYDVKEMIPWIRTFLCRITELHISDPELEKRFFADMEEMYAMYGLKQEGGEALDLQ